MSKQTQKTAKKNTYEDAPAAVAAPIKIIIAVALFGLALLLLYLTFATPQDGTGMGAIRSIMRGVGGDMAPMLSLILVWIGALLVFSARGKRIRKANIFINSILFLCLFAAVEIFCIDPIRQWGIREGFFREFLGYADFLSKAYSYGYGGGLLGALMAYPAEHFLGLVGGFLALLVLMALCLTATGRAQKIVRGVKEKSDAHAQRVEEKRSAHEAEHMFDKYDELDGNPMPRQEKRPPQRRQNDPQARQMGNPLPPNRRREAERGIEKRSVKHPMHRVSDPNRKSMYIDSAAAKPKPRDTNKYYDLEDDAEVTERRKRPPVNEEAPQTAEERKRRPKRVWQDDPAPAQETPAEFDAEKEIPTPLRRERKSEGAEKPVPERGFEDAEERKPEYKYEGAEKSVPERGFDDAEEREPEYKYEGAEKSAPENQYESAEEREPKRVRQEHPAPAGFDADEEIPMPLRRERKIEGAERREPERRAEKPAAAEPEEKREAPFTPRNYTEARPKRQTVTEGVRALDIDDEPSFDVSEKKMRPEPSFDVSEKKMRPEPKPMDADDEPPFDIPEKRIRPELKPMPEEEEADAYNYPPIDLLAAGDQNRNTMAHRDADQRKADKLVQTLESFGIETRLLGIAHGPAVTRFELQPAPGIKVSRITALSDDIALNLAAESVRIEAPIPGKAAVGVEIPNDKVEMVRLRDVLVSPEAMRSTSKIAVGLGKDNSGRYVIADIAKMPHVLIAGQTGSGKSVCINSIIASILYRATPEEVRMILIDPKVVELSIYNDIPHLIAPVVTDPKKASSALQWAVMEMTNRYKQFAERGVRDIKGYNKSLQKGEAIMPQFVIVIDELADLMMVSPGEVEDSICRLAQLARAAGMHLVIATQRPSVNVITGIIKANIPTRIAFSVASQVDSRTMIDHGGAEKLLGNGDMLFVPNGTNKPIRAQGSWISDEEVHAVVSYIKARTETTYDEDVVEKIENSVRSDAEKEEMEAEYDPKLPEAVEIVVEAGQASTSMLQRRMRVGYARAGRMIDEMEKRGIVSAADGAKPRDVLITREQMKDLFDE